jgi:hypothetical protein
MSTILQTPVTGPSAWKGTSLQGDNTWLHRLTREELAEIDAALRHAQGKGLAPETISRDDFPLPGLAARLEDVVSQVRDGRGFFVLRGLPTKNYTEDEMFAIFWGIGMHCGAPVSQNSYGDLLGHVFDRGVKMGEGQVRGYQTNQNLRFHTDRADMTALLCLRPARRGGDSSLVSSIAIHNEMAATTPELLAPLYAGMPYVHVEEGGYTEPRRIPVYSVQDGVLSCGIQRNTINTAITVAGIPVSDQEAAALDRFDALANDPDYRFDMSLEAGDIQFCNNYTVMHARTAYEDDPDPDKKRHLVRLWLKFDKARPVASHFKDYNGVPKELTR